MKMIVRTLLILLLVAQSQVWGQASQAAVSGMQAMQAELGKATHFFGVMTWEKSGGEAQTGNFWVKGETFRIQLEDRELLGDGTYLWEIHHRDRKVKKRHYDPYEAPAIVHALRMVRLDLVGEHIGITGTSESVNLEIETGSSVAQGTHLLHLNPVSHTITGFVLHQNQGGFLEQVTISQLRLDLSFVPETFSMDFENWKGKGYSLLDLAQGENLTVMPEEKALLPME